MIVQKACGRYTQITWAIQSIVLGIVNIVRLGNLADMRYCTIIPCKEHSVGLPGKNFKKLGGQSLFVWSITYSLQEGYFPIVSTDNVELVKAHIPLAISKRVEVMHRVVDESTTLSILKPVFEKYEDLERAALLQPTSPFRARGKLREMMARGHSITTDRIKGVGYWDGEFVEQQRRQDATKWFDHYDGNILVTERADILTGKVFNEPVPYPEPFPMTHEIDEPDDFEWAQIILKKHLNDA
ncbi:MAG: hypothetical protein RR382_00395 [Tannerellaceae bacterium]